MIIDFHTHIFPPYIVEKRQEYIRQDPLFALLYADPKAKLATADDLISMMDEQGIDRSVVLNIGWSIQGICSKTNDYIMESVSRFPGRLIGLGMTTFDSAEVAISEIERCHKGGIRGLGEVRLPPELWGNIQFLRPVMRRIAELGFLLLTHTSEPLGHIYPGKGNTTPETISHFIADFPDVTLVCAHWGGGLPFYALMPEVARALKNVYFDSAASPYLYQPAIYSRVIELVGEEKILFGSDYPLLTPRRLLKEIENLGLAPGTKERILSENARQLLKTG